MFLVFFLLWVVFNGRFTWEIAAFGAVLSGVLYAFCCAFLGYSPKKDLAVARLIPAALRYVWLLLTEIVKCNLALTRIVFAPRLEVQPRLVTFRTPLKGVFKSILADSITLTPGTITVHSEGDKLTIHCLDAQFMDGIEDTPFSQALLKMQQEREGKA